MVYEELERIKGYTDKQGVYKEFKYPQIKINGKTLQEDKEYRITTLAEPREWTGGKYSNYTCFAKFTGTDEAFNMQLGKQGFLTLKYLKAGKFTDLVITKSWRDNEQTGAKMPVIEAKIIYNSDVQGKNKYQPPMSDSEKDLWGKFIQGEEGYDKLEGWINMYVKECEEAGQRQEETDEERAKWIYEEMNM